MTLESATDSLVRSLQQWQVFYTALAGVAATLVGLLFVALYMNVDLFIKAEHQYMKRMSRMVFGSFTLVLFSSLIFLIPNQGRLGIGIPIGVAAVVAIGDTLHAFLELRGPLRGLPARDRKHIRQGLTRAVVGRAVLAVGCLMLVMDVAGALYWIAAPILAALLAACRNCWDLLVGARERLPH